MTVHHDRLKLCPGAILPVELRKKHTSLVSNKSDMLGREPATLPSESLSDLSQEQGGSNQPEENGPRAETSDGENSHEARSPTEIAMGVVSCRNVVYQ